MGYILHVVPDSIRSRRKVFIGSTKDVMGRSEYFATRAHRVRQFVSIGRSDDATLAMLRTADLDDCQAVLFEYEMYVRSLDFLRQNHPRIRRVVRAHNANLPHLVDQFHGRLRMIRSGQDADFAQATSSIHRALARFRLDCECADLADAILPICRWEADHYWGQLTTAEKVVTVPYFLPHRFVEAIPTRTRRNLLLFAMGTGSAMSPLLYDAGTNAVELINALHAPVAAEWDFRITGNLEPPDVLGPLGRLKPTGLLASPLPLLAEARALAIPSDLGMGFKTKILEAILAGCWVLVTDEVHGRLPHTIRPWCLAVDPHSPARFAEALRRCEASPPTGDPNALLREEAFRALDRVLAVDASLSPRPQAGRRGRASRLHESREEIATRSPEGMMAVDTGRVGVGVGVGDACPAEERGAGNAGQEAVSFGEGRVIYHAHLKPVLVRAGMIESSPVVFEYGVGAGSILKTVSEEGLMCGGVDESPATLGACRQFVPRASALGLIDESGACDFPGDWADFAYAVTAIQHIAKTSRIDRAISEMARILKPGGYVKLKFRSGLGRHPRARFLERDLLFNMEDRTVVLHLRPLRAGPRILRRLHVPALGVRRHNGRTGIPLSIGRLVGVLRKHGIEPLSVEPDRRQQGDMFWMTGRKSI